MQRVRKRPKSTAHRRSWHAQFSCAAQASARREIHGAEAPTEKALPAAGARTAAQDCSHSKLKSDDLPTFGRPTTPILRLLRTRLRAGRLRPHAARSAIVRQSSAPEARAACFLFGRLLGRHGCERGGRGACRVKRLSECAVRALTPGRQDYARTRYVSFQLQLLANGGWGLHALTSDRQAKARSIDAVCAELALRHAHL